MTFSRPKNNAITKTTVCITSRFAPANDCVLFVLVKLAFVPLPAGTVSADQASLFVDSGVANITRLEILSALLKFFSCIPIVRQSHSRFVPAGCGEQRDVLFVF